MAEDSRPQSRARVGYDGRPILRLAPTQGDRIAGALATTALAVLIGALIWAWPNLPARVPVHFGSSGSPDGWGPKSFLFLLPGVASIVHLSLSLLARYPHVYNYLWQITAKNAERQYLLAASMLRWLRTWILVGFTYLQCAQISVALGGSAGLGEWWAPAFVLVCLGIIVTYLYIGSNTAGPP
jgi:uncharacterized membrane protein